jgi:superfamily II DNA or RNA helicase
MEINKLITLWDYQEKAFKKVLHALKTFGRALMVMATGLGKTFISAKIVEELLQPGDTILFLCHDNGILNQNYDAFKEVLDDPSITFAKFYGAKKNWDADKHTIVFATFQSVLGHLQDEKRQNIFSPKHFSYIIVDESHHAQAETFSEVLQYFKPKWTLAMTATPDREDLVDIRELFGKEVVNYKLPEAIAKGWLTPIEYKVLSDGITKEEIEAICHEIIDEGIRISESQLNEKIFIRLRSKEQCRLIEEETKTGKRAIVFCENIDHLEHVASILPSTVIMHSRLSDKENDKALDAFKQGLVRHIAVVDKFNEGIHIPQAEVIAFLRATNSERIFLQQLGRILSKSAGKLKVTVLDFVANIDRIRKIKALAEEIGRIAGIRINGNNKNLSTLDEAIHLEGEGFSFDFSDEIVNVLSIFEKASVPYYKTWQEASKIAIKLKIKSNKEYIKKHYEDRKLPGCPHWAYEDFPGYHIFLGNDLRFYHTWELASSAARKLKVNSALGYLKKYKKDKKLCCKPQEHYKNWPGWNIFLNKISGYETWQEVSLIAIKENIKNQRDYINNHKKLLKKYP